MKNAHHILSEPKEIFKTLLYSVKNQTILILRSNDKEKQQILIFDKLEHANIKNFAQNKTKTVIQ